MIPIHRHLDTSEEVIILRGEVEEILYNDSGEETERIHLNKHLERFRQKKGAGIVLFMV